MVEVVVPKTVEAVASLTWRAHQSGLLRFVFRHEKKRAFPSGLSRRFPDRAQNVFLRSIENALRRIETKTIEMKLLDPIASVGDEKLAHRSGVWPIEIERVAPLVFVTIGKIVVGENPQIIPVWPEVIVNN